MTFEQVIYTGPELDDREILNELPPPLATLLVLDNGFIAYRGGLHVRGACRQPDWHSLREAWRGPAAIHSLYPAVSEADIPFAEDALGDQFLLRHGAVHRLAGETGELEPMAIDLQTFMAQVKADPIGYLGLQPLLAYEQHGERLAPGELLSVYPPYCADFNGERSFRAIPSRERLALLAKLANQLSKVPDGTAVSFKITP